MAQPLLHALPTPSPTPTPAKESALDSLVAFVSERRTKGEVPKDFGAFERDTHARVMAVEREILASELAAADVDTTTIEVGGVV